MLDYVVQAEFYGYCPEKEADLYVDLDLNFVYLLEGHEVHYPYDPTKRVDDWRAWVDKEVDNDFDYPFWFLSCWVCSELRRLPGQVSIRDLSVVKEDDYNLFVHVEYFKKTVNHSKISDLSVHKEVSHDVMSDWHSLRRLGFDSNYPVTKLDAEHIIKNKITSSKWREMQDEAKARD